MNNLIINGIDYSKFEVPAFIVSKNGSVRCFENDENKTTGKTMLRVGKKLAGRLLDGVLHNEFPRSEQ